MVAIKQRVPALDRLFARRKFVECGLMHTPCWEWTGAKTSQGYGNLVHEGRWPGAHRVAYELLVGPIPRGLHLDHLCRNRACFNPHHLEPVTCRENLRRGEGNAGKTHCVNGHEFTEENTWREKNGHRHCRECNRIRMRRRKTEVRIKGAVSADSYTGSTKDTEKGETE